MLHMTRLTTISLTFVLLLLAVSSIPVDIQATPASYERTPSQWTGGLVIDHNCINLTLIPQNWIDAAQQGVKVHYAHTSHGGQIVTGLDRLNNVNSSYAISLNHNALPTDDDALCILDGNPPETYVTPDLYWQTSDGLALTQKTLNDNPAITMSMWSWCTQLYYYTAEQTQEYLDAMASLEAANPDVTFVYMTCNAQATGEDGYNRWLRNNMIRQYCTENNKVLFDFADLDCWSNGEHSTYTYEVNGTTYTIPVEHEDFHGDQAGHTTFTSCEQKGRAFWWLVAKLAGWDAPTTTSTSGTTTTTTPTGQQTTGTEPPAPILTTESFTILAAIGVVVAIVLIIKRAQ